MNSRTVHTIKMAMNLSHDNNKEPNNGHDPKKNDGVIDTGASENLGLDADRSSDDQRIDRKYNMDNDIVSHNPDGESDDSDANLERGSSPLMDK